VTKGLAVLFAGALVSACVVAACGGKPEEQPAREGRTQGETTRAERTGEEPKDEPLERQQATYYGEEFAGNPTVSGEPYDPDGLTAAHKTLPFGTVLEVCYRGCARVRINDRNPRSTADLDLSRATADRIGLTEDGVGTVGARMIE
jgi:rare lipoprotein A